MGRSYTRAIELLHADLNLGQAAKHWESGHHGVKLDLPDFSTPSRNL